MRLFILGLALMQAASLCAETAASTAVVSTSQPKVTSPTSRWLELNTFSTSLRYRQTTNDVKINMFDWGQHREIADGRFKLDREGRYSIAFHASSGRYFNWAYADMIGGQFSDTVGPSVARLPLPQLIAIGHAFQVDPDGPTYAAGIQSRGGYFNVRQLYVSATPVDQVTIEFGSLPIEHGFNTEITSFDDDGYIAGERVRLHDKKHLYFDEIAVTSAYLGDPFKPNFFARGSRLKENNYQQYLAKKNFGTHAVASVDFTELRGTHTVREGLKVQVPELKVIDTARVELYQRINDVSFYGVPAPAGSGLAVAAGGTFKKKALFEAGFAAVDANYTAYSGSPFLQAIGLSWNSDSFENDKKAFVKAEWKVAPGLHLTGFFNHKVGQGPYTVDQQNLNAGFVYDFAEVMHEHKVF